MVSVLLTPQSYECHQERIPFSAGEERRDKTDKEKLTEVRFMRNMSDGGVSFDERLIREKKGRRSGKIRNNRGAEVLIHKEKIKREVERNVILDNNIRLDKKRGSGKWKVCKK